MSTNPYQRCGYCKGAHTQGHALYPCGPVYGEVCSSCYAQITHEEPPAAAPAPKDEPIELVALRELAKVVRAFAPTGFPMVYLGSGGESYATLLVCGATTSRNAGTQGVLPFDAATITIDDVEFTANKRVELADEPDEATPKAVGRTVECDACGEQLDEAQAHQVVPARAGDEVFVCGDCYGTDEERAAASAEDSREAERERAAHAADQRHDQRRDDKLTGDDR